VRSATGGIRDDPVEADANELGMQPFDERGTERNRALLFAEMMHERAAAAFDEHDLRAAALEQTNRRGIDLGCDHGLDAARDERDALASRRERPTLVRGARHAGALRQSLLHCSTAGICNCSLRCSTAGVPARAAR